jgi:hypothetical protein
MAGSGIITETSLVDAGKLRDVEALSIRDNQIIMCCKAPDVTLSDKSSIGGGIAAIGLFGTEITGNFIADNGMGRQEACGIFVLDGSDLEISRNIVAENGSREDPEGPNSYQAGIAAHFVFGNFLSTVSYLEKSGGLLGYPAVRIRGNQVICPAGQALTVTAMGGVVVDGNTFATRERKKQPTAPLDFGEKGACIYVLDLGLPVWLPEFALLLQMMATGQTNLHIEDFQRVDELFARFPDGRLLFHNNQVTFNTDQQEQVASLGPLGGDQWFKRAWDAATFSVLLLSLDDTSLGSNQFQATVPLYWQEGLQKKDVDQLAYMLKFVHVGTAGTVIRATSNGLAERLFSNIVSYASNATNMNVTTSNEATHYIITNAPGKVQANNLPSP